MEPLLDEAALASSVEAKESPRETEGGDAERYVPAGVLPGRALAAELTLSYFAARLAPL